ncbi:hypothetical protein [Cylindrospermum sp. FACHB-282]|uniref:hypothetical protein n=1 Tax=Cylindrospermum sp. FACHB-282 TaxID=2692794 RepID=UPI0016885C45|nr:hypothetical protein [Cylindrospermum sp. FACHB-282]MBD2388247.1 hypothetical protein [Cylindrospermum sp. FACHB-282]
MDVILWYSENKTPNSQENWDKIQSWWHELDGKQVEFRNVLGTLTDPSTGKKEDRMAQGKWLSIQNPRLEDNRLKFSSDNVYREIPVEKLELDINKNELKVYSSDSKKYIFIQIWEWFFQH